MNWTDEQHAIFSELDSGRQHAIVRARAGTGKTTTILEGLNYAQESDILLAAFNKSIADELRKRVANPAVQVKTLHALGFSMVRRHWPGVQVDDENERANGLVTRAYGSALPDALRGLARQLHTKARELMPFAQTIEEIEALAVNFDLLPDVEWEERGWGIERLAKGTLEILDLATEQTDIIDFADMIFLPLVGEMTYPLASLVLVDEAQDMSMPQLTLAQRVLRNGGRLVLVGDDRQAIYGFRGADSNALDRIKAELDATELGLKMTFRCGKRIVEEANQYVPDLLAKPDASEGSVETMIAERFTPTMVQEGAFVLSRTNAPLVGVCLDLIKGGTPATVRGRDIGKGLQKIVKKYYHPDLDQFYERLSAWYLKEKKRAKHMTKGAALRLRMVEDQIETLHALGDRAETTDEVNATLGRIFSDETPWRTVTCSTVHRAKGLESKQVWILTDTFKWDGQEEDNLKYVAITRAKEAVKYLTATGKGFHATGRIEGSTRGTDDGGGADSSGTLYDDRVTARAGVEAGSGAELGA
ncbi:MAG: ATP-dependent helicase [Patescibacteria group bacterium]|nr:ATP-dependent helicase [Patescibacteria group bacterium]